MAKKIVIKGNQKNAKRYIIAFLRRFHLLLFFVLVSGALSGAVVLINKTLADTSSQDYTSSISAGNIDEDTLNRIQSFHSSDAPLTSLPSQSGRINPFSE